MKIEEQKHNQMMNYLGMLQGYENRMADQRMAGMDFTQEIGMLTRAMMLYTMTAEEFSERYQMAMLKF